MANDLASAFLADILEHPADRTPRLIYADWLEETRGDDPCVRDRARFIRAQCAVESLDPGESAYLVARVEAERLLARYEREWTQDLIGLGRAWRFRGGFPEKVVGAPGLLLEHGARLFARVPLRSFSIRQAARGWGKLMAHPFLERIEDLEINTTFHGRPNWLDQLAASRYVGRLRRLVLDRNPLRLTDGNTLGSGGFPALEELSFGHETPPREMLATLGRRELSRRIHTLRVPLGWDYDAALPGLLEGAWPALRNLHLSGMNFTAYVATDVAGSSWLGHVERLTFEGVRFQSDGLAPVLTSAQLGEQLRELTLVDCALPLSADPCLPVGNWPNLRVLRFGHQRGDLAFVALLKGPLPAHLHALELGSVDLRGAGLDPILNVIEQVPLHSLSMVRTGLGDRELLRLAELPALEKVQELDLSANLFTDIGALALLESPHTSGLLILRVQSCRDLSPACRRRLATRFPVVQSVA